MWFKGILFLPTTKLYLCLWDHIDLVLQTLSLVEMEDDSGHFVSSVCWRGKSKIMVAANSTSNIKLLEMI